MKATAHRVRRRPSRLFSTTASALQRVLMASSRKMVAALRAIPIVQHARAAKARTVSHVLRASRTSKALHACPRVAPAHMPTARKCVRVVMPHAQLAAVPWPHSALRARRTRRTCTEALVLLSARRRTMQAAHLRAPRVMRAARPAAVRARLTARAVQQRRRTLMVALVLARAATSQAPLLARRSTNARAGATIASMCLIAQTPRAPSRAHAHRATRATE